MADSRVQTDLLAAAAGSCRCTRFAARVHLLRPAVSRWPWQRRRGRHAFSTEVRWSLGIHRCNTDGIRWVRLNMPLMMPKAALHPPPHCASKLTMHTTAQDLVALQA